LVVTVEPETAAIAAAKILAIEDQEFEKRIHEFQLSKRKEIEEADESTKKLK
jgi:phosphoribosylcarboxyaminoimidazole (NCAIR) mutase